MLLEILKLIFGGNSAGGGMSSGSREVRGLSNEYLGCIYDRGDVMEARDSCAHYVGIYYKRMNYTCDERGNRVAAGNVLEAMVQMKKR